MGRHTTWKTAKHKKDIRAYAAQKFLVGEVGSTQAANATTFTY